MSKGKIKLTETEERALDAEVERIAKLGSEWSPTEEALKEVLLAIKKVSHEEHVLKQKKKVPGHFKRFARLINTGELTKSHVAKLFGVSYPTLNKWLKEWEQEQNQYSNHPPTSNQVPKN